MEAVMFSKRQAEEELGEFGSSVRECRSPRARVFTTSSPNIWHDGFCAAGVGVVRVSVLRGEPGPDDPGLIRWCI
jgi:hypothetical protein